MKYRSTNNERLRLVGNWWQQRSQRTSGQVDNRRAGERAEVLAAKDRSKSRNRSSSRSRTSSRTFARQQPFHSLCAALDWNELLMPLLLLQLVSSRGLLTITWWICIAITEHLAPFTYPATICQTFDLQQSARGRKKGKRQRQRRICFCCCFCCVQSNLTPILRPTSRRPKSKDFMAGILFLIYTLLS